MSASDHLRSEETAESYRTYRATGALEKSCPLCRENSLFKYKFWKIINNDFPYDRIAETHHMVIPIRHVDEPGLTIEEKEELYEIKHSKLQQYDLIVEATAKNKSIPAHFHIHLINTKPLIGLDF